MEAQGESIVAIAIAIDSPVCCRREATRKEKKMGKENQCPVV